MSIGRYLLNSRIIGIYCSSAILFIISGCSSSRKVVPFADNEWKINGETHYVYNKDLSYVFDSGNEWLNKDVAPLIGTEVGINRYPKLRNYLNDVLSDVRLDIDSILLYLPTEQTVFVTYSMDDQKLEPPTITEFNINVEDPLKSTYGTFHNLLGAEKLKSDGSQMLTNMFYNDKHKRYVVVNRLRYGDRPIAMITILESVSDKLRKYSEELFGGYYYCAFSRGQLDYSDREQTYVIGREAVQSKNQGVRNYLLGQKLKQLKNKRRTGELSDTTSVFIQNFKTD